MPESLEPFFGKASPCEWRSGLHVPLALLLRVGRFPFTWMASGLNLFQHSFWNALTNLPSLNTSFLPRNDGEVKTIEVSRFIQVV
jgi:hypothetical protein